VAGFRAGAGWDPCTGLGSLRGTQLLDALREALDAGVPSSDASRPSHVTELRAPELDQVG
jgi:hypothetical protein